MKSPHAIAGEGPGATEFYVGWEDRAPPGIRRQVRRALAVLLALSAGLGVVLALAQRTIGFSVFEWGTVKSFTGIFQSRPYPHLLVPRPRTMPGPSAFSSYYLVNPFKFGLDAAVAARFDGQSVQLKGTLIYRGDQTMIEVVPNSIAPADAASVPSGRSGATNSPATTVDLGEHRLVGEIVDSKCFLGVMNPGSLAPHRACAIRCLSGGIPPVLLVRRTNAPALYFLLVSREGLPVNHEVLDRVAEPVAITGQVERQGTLLILRADPRTYRRATE